MKQCILFFLLAALSTALPARAGVTALGVRSSDGRLDAAAGSISLNDPAFAGPLNDARIAASVQNVDSIDALRSATIPTAAVSGVVQVSGYYEPGDTDEVTYVWNAGSTASDDGGAVIAPASLPASGRWLMVWDHSRANVRHWGARLTDTAHPTFDSLGAINAAINALPANDTNPICSPGAGGGGHTRQGTVYFPGAGGNQGYVVTGTVYGSAFLTFEGSSLSHSRLALWPGKATNLAGPPTYTLKVCANYQGGTPSESNPNETFYAAIKDLEIDSNLDNPNGIALYYVGCNGNGIDHVRVEGALQDAYINANSLAIDHLTSGAATTHAGVVVNGYGLSCHDWDIEHANYLTTTTTDGTSYAASNLDPSTGFPYPAVRISGQGIFLTTLSTESSALSLEIMDAVNVMVADLHTNPNATGMNLTKVPGAAQVNIHGACQGVSVMTMCGPSGGVPALIDTSHGLRYGSGSDYARNERQDGMSGRLVYSQDGYFQHGYFATLDAARASVASLTTPVAFVGTSGPGPQYDGLIYLGSGSSNTNYGLILESVYGSASNELGTFGSFDGGSGRGYHDFLLYNRWNGATQVYGDMNSTGWGINKLHPSAALDVNGDGKVSGKLAVGTVETLAESTTAPTATAGSATFWVSSADHKLHVVDSTGVDHPLW